MKKTVVAGLAVALLGASYAGATWYLGQAAQERYQEALQSLRKVAGEDVVVEQQYQRGFWTSEAKTVLQWKPPADEAQADGTPPQPVRLSLQSTVRHGPLAGARLAAAVIETKVSMEGLSERAQKLLERTTAPRMTLVSHLTGSKDIAVLVPAGEIAEGGNFLRWQALQYDMSLDAGITRLRGRMQWPELSLRAPRSSAADVDEDEEMDEEQEPAPAPATAKHFTMTMSGMQGDFDMNVVDGIWLLSPGTSQGRIDKMTVSELGEGDAQRALAALQNLEFKAVIERKDALYSWVTTMQGKGSIGPLAFDSLSLRESVGRIDAEAMRMVQQAIVAVYQKDLQSSLADTDAPVMAALQRVAPRLVAGLPSYAMELKLSLGGKEGSLQYGGQIKSAPQESLVQEKGWGKALLAHSTLSAQMAVPKAWIPQLAQAVGKEVPEPQELDMLLGMAQGQGFVKLENDTISSQVQLEAGELLLNGKAIKNPLLGSLQ